jgi:hypothetical protein
MQAAPDLYVVYGQNVDLSWRAYRAFNRLSRADRHAQQLEAIGIRAMCIGYRNGEYQPDTLPF